MNSGYKLIKVIGKGAKSEIWEASDALGQSVAIKFSDRTQYNALVNAELGGITLLRKLLTHSGLIHIRACGVVNNEMYIVMELAECSLDNLLSDKFACSAGFPQVELIRYLTQVAHVLDDLHLHNIVHGAIWPEHIVLVKGQAKIIDYTFVHYANGQVPAAYQHCKLSNCSAPELTTGSSSVHCDQYSLAASYANLRGSQLLNNVSELPQTGTQLSQKEQDILRKALASDPMQRFRSCADFAKALEEAMV